jgi:site-specific DNA-methyltransferase (adenine-specific)
MPKVGKAPEPQSVQIGDCMLVLGDCLERLSDLPWHSVDLVLTDPPYGIDYSTNYRGSEAKDGVGMRNDHPESIDGKTCGIHGDGDLDFLAHVLPVLAGKLKPSGHLYLFCSPKKIDTALSAIRQTGLLYKSLIVWDKNDWGPGDLFGSFGSTYELIIHAAKSNESRVRRRSSDILRVHKIHPRKQVHPHQKPVPLLNRLIKISTDRGGLVVDPFMGSASAALACIKSGRRFLGFEVDPAYYERAVKRVQKFSESLAVETKNPSPVSGGREI